MRAKPDDPLRFLSTREGGTGTGFSKYPDKRLSPYSFGAASRSRDRARIAATCSIDGARVSDTSDAVKRRARTVLLLAVERVADALSDETRTYTLPELAQTAGALGRISGLADEEQGGQLTVRLVREDARPPALAPGALALPAPGGTERAPA